MAEERSKPSFIRRDWHKKIKLGRTVKKLRKWKGAKGRQNKIRLNRKGQAQRPKIGWGADKKIKGNVKNMEYTKISNVLELKNLKSGAAILISSVGMKKRKEILAEAQKMKLVVLNNYKKVEESKK